jgi:hypothetical protein
LLRSLLGEDIGLEPLTQRLVERTQGNPFFLEESVRTLVETQVLVGAPGAYRLARVLPSIQVPATVQVILAARIDRPALSCARQGRAGPPRAVRRHRPVPRYGHALLAAPAEEALAEAEG